MNPFPPETNAHLNYDSGMGFPPIETAPALWKAVGKVATEEIKKTYPLLNWEETKQLVGIHDLFLFTRGSSKKIGGILARNAQQHVWITTMFDPSSTTIKILSVPIDPPVEKELLTKQHTLERLKEKGLQNYSLKWADDWCKSLR